MATNVVVSGFGRGGGANVSFVDEFGLSEVLPDNQKVRTQIKALIDNLTKYKDYFNEGLRFIVNKYVQQFINYNNVATCNMPLLSLAILIYHRYGKELNNTFLYEPFVLDKLYTIISNYNNDPNDQMTVAGYQADLLRYWIIVISFMHNK